MDGITFIPSTIFSAMCDFGEKVMQLKALWAIFIFLRDFKSVKKEKISIFLI